MKPTIFSLFAFACSFSCVTALTNPPSDVKASVLQASAKDFDSLIKSDHPVMVKFVAPWCGHCKKLEPEYVKAADALSSEGISLVTVDCTADKELCSQHEIRGYPTLKVFRSGKEVNKYQGARDTESIVKFMRKQVAPVITEVVGPEELSKLRESDEIVFVAFYDESNEGNAAVYKKIAENMHNDYTFARMKTAPEEFKSASLVAFRKFDEPQVVYKGNFVEESVKEWIVGESIPLAAEIGPENYTKYIDSGLPLAYFFYADDKQKEQYQSAITAAAKHGKGKVNTVFINGGLYGQHAEVLNIEQKWPAFVIHDANSEHDLKYPLPKGDKMSAESLTKFMDSFMKGSLQPHYKSEPIPKDKDNKGPVIKLVHDGFDKIAFDKSKDVLVEIHAPWCGACKRIKPEYEELAKAVAAKTDKIVIADMDGVANDIPASLNLRLEHFPTFKFIKAGTNEIINYDGALSYNGLAEFLETNASTKITLEHKAESAPDTAEDEGETTGESERDEL